MQSSGLDTILQVPALLCLLCTMLGAKPAVGDGEDFADLLKIPGMTQAEDGTLLFKNEKVKSVKSIGGGQDSKLPKTYKEEDDYEEAEVGWDPLNEVNEITPIKSMTELKSLKEITEMTPVKSIEEIISMKEIKSIEEIKEKIAREFIRKHGLKNLIAGGGASFMEGENGPRPYEDGDITMESSAEDLNEQELHTLEKNILKDEAICDSMSKELDEMKSKLSAFEKVKENHCSLKETEMTAYEGLKDKLTLEYGFDGNMDETIEKIESVEVTEVLSKTALKTVQEIKSMESVKSLQGIMNLYDELTKEQAGQFRAMVAAKLEPSYIMQYFSTY